MLAGLMPLNAQAQQGHNHVSGLLHNAVYLRECAFTRMHMSSLKIVEQDCNQVCSRWMQHQAMFNNHLKTS